MLRNCFLLGATEIREVSLKKIWALSFKAKYGRKNFWALYRNNNKEVFILFEWSLINNLRYYVTEKFKKSLFYQVVLIWRETNGVDRRRQFAEEKRRTSLPKILGSITKSLIKTLDENVPCKRVPVKRFPDKRRVPCKRVPGKRANYRQASHMQGKPVTGLTGKSVSLDDLFQYEYENFRLFIDSWFASLNWKEKEQRGTIEMR